MSVAMPRKRNVSCHHSCRSFGTRSASLDQSASSVATLSISVPSWSAMPTASASVAGTMMSLPANSASCSGFRLDVQAEMSCVSNSRRSIPSSTGFGVDDASKPPAANGSSSSASPSARYARQQRGTPVEIFNECRRQGADRTACRHPDRRGRQCQRVRARREARHKPPVEQMLHQRRNEIRARWNGADARVSHAVRRTRSAPLPPRRWPPVCPHAAIARSAHGRTAGLLRRRRRTTG